MPKSHVIYESNDIVVHYHTGPSDTLLITFLGIGHEANALHTYFGKPIVESHNIACIGFTTKERNWYYCPNMEEALKIAKEYSKHFKKIIALGISAGAYASIKYSKNLKSDITLAFAPQLSIDDRECEVIPEWASLCTPQMRGMGIKASDIYGDIFLFYDKHHFNDTKTALTIHDFARFSPDSNVSLINIPNGGHILYESIKGSKNFLTLIEIANFNLDPQKKSIFFTKEIRNMRRHNYVNIYNKIKNSYHKHPYLVWKLLASQKFLSIPKNDLILNDETLFYKLAFILNDKGYCYEASTLVQAMIAHHTTNNFNLYLIKNDYHIKGVAILFDHRGRTLGYSVKKKQCVSSNIIWMENDATPVQCILVHNKIYPTVSYFGERFFLNLEKNGSVVLSTQPSNIMLNGQHLQEKNGKYLSVVDDTTTNWVDNCLTWETFSLVTI
ncbi:hypothetical protein [Acetobacter sp.]|uniref:hypothetical protein n=1 Tax=Acetobacter sp. TaxID=440 RepID=UPI00258661BC|nr:hypothetical protein [Acetobacter sp.]MCC6103548.1 hypothetical protein [Acetobacter sp.]